MRIRKPVSMHVSTVIEPLEGTQGTGARVMINAVDCDAESVGVGDEVRPAFARPGDSPALSCARSA